MNLKRFLENEHDDSKYFEENSNNIKPNDPVIRKF